VDHSPDQEGFLFLTSGSSPYHGRWKEATAASFETMAMFIEMPVLERGFEELFGADATQARFRDLSTFTDVALNS